MINVESAKEIGRRADKIRIFLKQWGISFKNWEGIKYTAFRKI